MEPSKQNEPPIYSPTTSQASSISLTIPPSNYLLIPSTRPAGPNFVLPGPISFQESETDLLESPLYQDLPLDSVPQIREPSHNIPPATQSPSTTSRGSRVQTPEPNYMSVYSSASADSEFSVYSNPPARIYRVPSFQKMSASRKPSAACIFGIPRQNSIADSA